MPVIQSNLSYVVKRYPDHRDNILQFFKENQNYQTICEDYRKCLEAHQHWNESGSKEASVRREEYATLLVELETEIIQNINESYNI